MRLAKNLLETVLLGAATVVGVRLMQEIQNPYSGVRLRASTIVDRLREVTAR